ncbi:MAG TPA: NAD-dependent epimerase/dehydratase family protein [Bacteroidales bacterium]|nr:NAD-dependent epimerase/dehydratase family protein [Bacteroidales bacterium]
MNILITGVHGFVGGNLIKSLSSVNCLYGLDIVSPEKEGIKKTFSWKDLESGTLPNIDAIIHLAGKAHDTKNQSEASVYFDINTGLTKKIYDFYLKSSATKFIFFSSVKAAADSVQGAELTEEVVPSPKGPYGESKMAAEAYIQANMPTDPSKSVYILRPCMIHGPGNKGNLNLLYKVVSKGFPWPLGAFENRRSFTSIDDLCYVIEKLISKDIPSGIYNMGDDEALSTNELIEVMCKSMNKKGRIWKINRRLIEGCARIGTIIHFPLNSERLRKLTENYVVSNEKIKKALQIEKMPITAKEGLEKTFRSFQH